MSVCKHGFRSSFISYFISWSYFISFASWFPTLISCSLNLPRVYIRLCKHGKHFTFLHLGREAFQTPFTPGIRFQNITSFTGGSYLNSALFTKALQESLSVHFVFFKIFKLFGVLLFGHNHIRSDRFTFRSRDFPMTLLHLGYVFQNFMLEYKIP